MSDIHVEHLLELKEDVGQVKAQVGIVLDGHIRNEQRLEAIGKQVNEVDQRLEAHEEYLRKLRNRAVGTATVVATSFGWLLAKWDAIISFVRDYMG